MSKVQTDLTWLFFTADICKLKWHGTSNLEGVIYYIKIYVRV